jgi:hypothetical protein
LELAGELKGAMQDFCSRFSDNQICSHSSWMKRGGSCFTGVVVAFIILEFKPKTREPGFTALLWLVIGFLVITLLATVVRVLGIQR